MTPPPPIDELLEPFARTGVNEPVEPDEVLYSRIRAGDIRAFDTLYARYAGPLFGFLHAHLQNRADAEDVFHESFLRTLDSREITLDSGAFRAWLYRVARNAALNRLRSQKRGTRALSRIPEAVAPPPVDVRIAEHQMLHALDGAVARLPPNLSDVYHLRSSGLTYEEIASVLEIPLGTLKSRMNQLVVHLREELGTWSAR